MPKLRVDSVSTLPILQSWLSAVLIAGIVCVAVTAVVYRRDLATERAALEQETTHVIELQEELLLFELRAIHSDLLYLASQHPLQRFVAGDVSAREALERAYENFAVHKGVYDQIRFIDETGQEAIRVNYEDGVGRIVPPGELQSKASRYYFRHAMSVDAGSVFVSPLDLNEEHGKIERPLEPVIRFITPVFDPSGNQRGLVVLNYLGAHLLAQLKQIATGFRGETMLVNAQGEYLQAPDAAREWGWLLGHARSFRGDFPRAWEHMVEARAGTLRVEGDLFHFQRVAPSQRWQRPALTAEGGGNSQDASALILVSRVPARVANARSSQLLARLSLISLGAMALLGVVAYYWARSREDRRFHERCVAQSESRLRHLSSALLEAQETERRNMSRVLHDELGQMVTAIRLDLGLLENQQKRTPDDPALRRAIDGADRLLESVHQFAASARPSVLDDIGLEEALTSLIDELRTRSGLRVDAVVRLGERTIPAKIRENAFRIVQEALANVVSHADTDRAGLRIESDNRHLRIEIEDHGVGFDPALLNDSPRLGVLGMRERTELLNGEFQLQSSPGAGVRISVEIPLGASSPDLSQVEE